MSVWNHRVVHQHFPDAVEDERDVYSIYEVWYPHPGGEPDGYGPKLVSAASVEDLRWVLEKCLGALDVPVIEMTELEKPG